MTVPAGFSTMSKSYDSQGFLIIPTPTSVASSETTGVAGAAIDGDSNAPKATNGGMSSLTRASSAIPTGFVLFIILAVVLVL